jgi:hypothetical protein
MGTNPFISVTSPAKKSSCDDAKAASLIIAVKGLPQSRRLPPVRARSGAHLSNLPQHGSPFEWMNVSPKPKPSLCGGDDRRDIRHATIGDFTEALTSARALDGDMAPRFCFVPSTVIVQSSIRR